MKENDIIKLKENFNGIPKNTKGTIVFMTESSKFVTIEFIINGNTRIETMLKTNVYEKENNDCC